MDEQELRAALASWLRRAREDQPPDVAVIGRRLRRRRARGALACVAVLAAVAGTTAGIRLTADRSAPQPASPPVTATVPRCTNPRVSWSGTQADSMSGEIYALVFRNASGRACVIDGWPRVTVRGSALLARLRIVDGTGTAGGGPIEPTGVVLGPGASAAADVFIGYPPTALGCVAPTWTVTPPGGGRATVLHEGPVRYGRLPAGPVSVCADASIAVSPVFPGSQPRINPYPPQAVPTPSPLYSEAAGPEPPRCAGTALRARVTDTATDRQGSFVILRVGVRGSECTLRDGGLPVLRLNEASGGTSPVGKEFPTPQSLKATQSLLVTYGGKVGLPLSGGTEVAAVLLLPPGGACQKLTSVTIYPGAAAMGAGLTVGVSGGLAVCRLPLVLGLLPVSPAGEAANLARAALADWAKKRP